MEREEWSSCPTSHELDLSSVSDHDNVLYDCIMRYFTSDLHLGSSLINKYAHRPFASAEEACVKLLRNIEQKTKLHDRVIHVGDFMLTGSDRHGTEEDVGLKISQRQHLDAIQRGSGVTMILLAGNHDDGHNCEADCKSMVLDLNQNYRNVYVSHFPSYHPDYHGPFSNPNYGVGPKIVLCGHVHDKWLLNYDAKRHVLNINVGVDVWDYKPVRDAEITELLDYFKANLWSKIANDGSHWSDFKMTRKAFDEFRLAHSTELRAQREARKAEKHAKKGLTPEECERRKIEAMKKKGLM